MHLDKTHMPICLHHKRTKAAENYVHFSWCVSNQAAYDEIMNQENLSVEQGEGKRLQSRI
jgi:hypothetical protein